ncbi:MAG: glycosyltransferase [Deltaproteobacteria bacterium]|nr:glycosyltransferase [Deltaproteobacteria bacterium]
MPKLSIVIPVFNEEAILDSAVRTLLQKLEARHHDFELILAENGSTDATANISAALAAELPRLKVLHTGRPNYGKALRAGIDSAAGDVVVCDEIDLGDIDFYERALEVLAAGADLVVGSKRHHESMDDRPWLRRRGTAVINTLLRLSLGFTGTDTHGLKAFKRARLLPVVAACQVEHNLFASELVIRAARMGLDVREIPLRLHEIRPPSVGLMRRVPHVLVDLARLVYVIRIKGA